MRLSRNATILVTLIYLCVGLFFFSYRYLEKGAHNYWPDWRPDFLTEMSAALATYFLFWPLFWFTNKYPLLRGSLWQHGALHLMAMPLWSAAHTTLLAIMRPPLFELVLDRGYDYGYLPVRYLMEFSIGAFSFSAQVGVLTAVRFQHELRQREVRTALLEKELAQAHLDALRLQLHPHFLFNALNAVSSVMYDDPRKADRMIANLSEFLRAVLRKESTHSVVLGEELRLLDQYLAIMEVRFGERLRVERFVPDDLLDAEVPPLLLQPLVENCVQHGVDPRTGMLTIELTVGRQGEYLTIAVRDHGRGIASGRNCASGAPVAGAERSGLGISNTRRRLEQLYGNGQSFTLSNADGAGAIVTIRIPLVFSSAREEYRDAG